MTPALLCALGWGWLGDSCPSCVAPTGPSAWHKAYPLAQGDRQSPINIVPTETVYDGSLSPIFLSYENCMSTSISNNGHSVVVEFDDTDDRSGEDAIRDVMAGAYLPDRTLTGDLM